MKDNIIIALTDNASFRVYVADTTELVKKAQEIHQTFPVASAALGRTLTAAAIMGAMMKNPNASETIQFKGNGPLKTVIAVTDSSSNVRGYVGNPFVDLPLNEIGKLDVKKAIGTDGYLSIIRDDGNGSQPYVGQVEITSGEVAEDITYYYATSEQIPTAIALGVLVGKDGVPISAGGYMLQMMPGYAPDDEIMITKFEEKLKTLPPISKMIADGMDTKEILDKLMGDIKYGILEEVNPSYKCSCSRARVEKALISIGKNDLQSLIDTQNGTEVNCQFCNKNYNFTADDILELIKSCKH